MITMGHSGCLYNMDAVDTVTLERDRYGTPAKLTFSVINDVNLAVEEGALIEFVFHDDRVFRGYVFKTKSDADKIEVTAYDQLRYLKNKDSFDYKNIKLNRLVELIAQKYGLRTGALVDTGYVIPARKERDSTLIDIISTAISLTLTNSNRLYILRDNYGEIVLEDIESLRSGIVLNNAIPNFTIESSIDDKTYNVIEVKSNDETIKPTVAKDDASIKKWGVLKYVDGSLKEGENPNAKAKALLALYNHRTRSFSASDLPGDVSIVGGSSLAVMVNIGSEAIKQYMVVDSVKHSFTGDLHVMSLKLLGGI
ncbi:XkdQ/YqbQ family protein [Fusibacter paucivorans]